MRRPVNPDRDSQLLVVAPLADVAFLCAFFTADLGRASGDVLEEL